MIFSLSNLLNAIASHSILKYEVKLTPISAGGLVFPPTYAGKEGESKKKSPHISFRRAWVDGATRDVVVLDSAQSQANRFEHSLLDAITGRRLAYPDIRIRFPGLPEEPNYSVLQLSHRVYDATIRACTLDGVAFPDSEIGRAVYAARTWSAEALFTHAPATLLLGGWDSHSGGGPLVAKVPRALTSEIIGLDAEKVEISATKVDPMDIRKSAGTIVKPSNGGAWQLKGTPSAAGLQGKSVDPSGAGFGSVPASLDLRAASISGALQLSVLSFSALRRIAFPDESGERSDTRDAAGRAVLAALGIYGIMAQAEAGYLLRSRCELVPTQPPAVTLLGRSLSDSSPVDIDLTQAGALLAECLEAAGKVNLRWRERPVELLADPRLVELVRNSRRSAAIEGDE